MFSSQRKLFGPLPGKDKVSMRTCYLGHSLTTGTSNFTRHGGLWGRSSININLWNIDSYKNVSESRNFDPYAALFEKKNLTLHFALLHICSNGYALCTSFVLSTENNN